MAAFFTNNETYLRLIAFIATLVLIITWENLASFRKNETRLKHIKTNLSLAILNTLILRFILPTGLIGIAIFSSLNSLGLFNIWQLPLLVEVLLSLILFDCIIYWQHRLMHKSNWLWTLHKVHHSDQCLDFSSGLRFHPLEMFFSFSIKAIVVVLLGLNPLSIIIFEITLNSFAIFNHGNIKLPIRIEQVLRKIIITPEMHRIHHSIVRSEQDSNFGFSTSIWDSIFGSFQKPDANEENIILGRKINEQRVKSDSIVLILSEPFRKT